MSNTEYGFIKTTFPKWAKLVEKTAKVAVADPNNEHAIGVLHGLAQAMVATKQCGDAVQFVEYAVAKERRIAG